MMFQKFLLIFCLLFTVNSTGKDIDAAALVIGNSAMTIEKFAYDYLQHKSSNGSSTQFGGQFIYIRGYKDGCLNGDWRVWDTPTALYTVYPSSSCQSRWKFDGRRLKSHTGSGVACLDCREGASRPNCTLQATECRHDDALRQHFELSVSSQQIKATGWSSKDRVYFSIRSLLHSGRCLTVKEHRPQIVQYADYAHECRRFEVKHNGARLSLSSLFVQSRDTNICYRDVFQLEPCRADGLTEQTFFLEIVGVEQLKWLHEMKRLVPWRIWDLITGKRYD